MELDSVRELKARARARVVVPMLESVVRARFARAASDLDTLRVAQPERFIALGVSKHPAGRQYRLAIRLQRRSLQDRPELARLTEIEGVGERAFCDGGDSGSLIVNSRNEAVALLFAGSESGGHNDAGLTYANPIQDVLKALKLELLW